MTTSQTKPATNDYIFTKAGCKKIQIYIHYLFNNREHENDE